ncbi:MAG: non-canonical purine NTP pyrophosphatase [Patescibacteria group bacterium]
MANEGVWSAFLVKLSRHFTIFSLKFQLLLATANPSKARELSAALADLDCEILTLKDFPKITLPPEDGAAFEENARIKAEFCCAQTGLPALADDSGILVEALPGELGVQTVRFGAGENASDEDWLAHFLARMENKKNRRAKFVCVLALANPPARFARLPFCQRGIEGGFGKTLFFRGEVTGEILEKIGAPILPRIPLSSVFRADGAEKVFAAMNKSEKAQFSHRGKAVEKLLNFLDKNH